MITEEKVIECDCSKSASDPNKCCKNCNEMCGIDAIKKTAKRRIPSNLKLKSSFEIGKESTFDDNSSDEWEDIEEKKSVIKKQSTSKTNNKLSKKRRLSSSFKTKSKGIKRSRKLRSHSSSISSVESCLLENSHCVNNNEATKSLTNCNHSGNVSAELSSTLQTQKDASVADSSENNQLCSPVPDAETQSLLKELALFNER